MSRSSVKNSKSAAADRQGEKRGRTDNRAKSADAAADPGSRARSILKRFGKSIAHLAK